MAKAELFRIPVVGWMMRMAGDIPVRRGSLSSSMRALDRACWYLERNCPVIIFPEGTRSRDGKLLRFTRGAFKLAVDADVPLLPMVVYGTGETLPRGSLTVGPPRTIHLHLLDPIETDDLEAGDVDALRDRVRTQMAEKLAELRAEDEAPAVRNAH